MKPINLIFDTDLGSDCDDVMALTYLIYAKRQLNLNLLAITHSHVTPDGPIAIRALFRTFGEDVPVVGRMVEDIPFPDRYAKVMADRFATENDRLPCESAVTVMRRALATSNAPCVICGVGMFTNIAALLQSPPDEISPLDGVALVKEKCEKIVLMAGTFRDRSDGSRSAEWNVKCDIPSAKAFAALCPVPNVFLPFEVGESMRSGKPAIEKYADANPLTCAFIAFGSLNGRHSWDPATAVYAVEGVKDFLCESEAGDLSVTDDGATYLTPNPSGLTKILTLKPADGKSPQDCKDAFASYIDACAEVVCSAM